MPQSSRSARQTRPEARTRWIRRRQGASESVVRFAEATERSSLHTGEALEIHRSQAMAAVAERGAARIAKFLPVHWQSGALEHRGMCFGTGLVLFASKFGSETRLLLGPWSYFRRSRRKD